MGASFGFAYYLDTCKEERERGVTIQCNTKEFFTEKYHYTIVDAPGHKDYIKNMITGSATADVGLLLVPAEKGGFEAAIAKADAKAGVEEGQTRQHARLLYLLGVDQIIVGVNKMDACNWDEGRFNEIKEEFVKMLQLIGFKPKKVLQEAGPGDSVGLSIKGIAKDEKVQPGDIIYVQKEGELLPIKSFNAVVAVQEHPGVLKPGYCPVVFCRTAKVACKMTKIVWKQSKKTGGAKVENPPELSQYENAEVVFEPSQPLFVEPL